MNKAAYTACGSDLAISARSSSWFHSWTLTDTYVSMNSWEPRAATKHGLPCIVMLTCVSPKSS